MKNDVQVAEPVNAAISPPDRSAPSTDSATLVFVEQLKTHFAQTRSTVTAGMAGAIFLTVQMGVLTQEFRFGWLLPLVIINAARLLLARRFAAQPQEPEQARYWHRLTLLVVGASGVTWGATAFLLYPDPEDTYALGALMIDISMLCVIGMFTYVQLLSACVAFVLPITLMYGTQQVISGHDFGLVAGAHGTILFVIVFAIARRLNRVIVDEIRLNLDKSRLIDKLQRSTQRLKEDIRRRTEAERALRAANVDLGEARDQLIQSEKMASVGQLAAGVAHEINNPIGYVYSNLGTLESYWNSLNRLLPLVDELQDSLPADSDLQARIVRVKQQIRLGHIREDLGPLLEESREGLERVKKIVQDLKGFSHVGRPEWQTADLHEGLESTLNIVHSELKYKTEVIKHYGELPPVECLPFELNQVFMNLLMNAAQAIDEHGTITIRTGHDGDQVWVEISDTGRGIAEADLPRIFDAFFTTKRVGEGTGLGLSLAYSTVKKHNGRIEVDSAQGRGTTFRIWLDVRQRTSAAEAEIVA